MDRHAHGQVRTEVVDERILVTTVDRVEKKNAFTPKISDELAAAYTRLDDDPVFMTETARQSDDVLPATTRYEKFEAFLNFDFPKYVFQLRRPVPAPPVGTLPEPEIHARLVDSLPELLDELAELHDETPPGDDPDWPLLLSAGERRSFTANTILRDPAWRMRASVVVTVAVDDSVQSGHVSLPNGLGLDHVESGARHQTGVAPNEPAASEDRDPWAGTPWHKTAPARLEPAPS